MNYYLMALRDPLDMLSNIRHLSNPIIAVDNYKQEINTFGMFENHDFLPGIHVFFGQPSLDPRLYPRSKMRLAPTSLLASG